MIQAIIPGEPVEYILKCEKDTKNPTVWKLKSLSMSEQAFVGELASSLANASLLAMVEAQQKILSIGLISAAPFKNALGKEAVFTRDGDPFFKGHRLFTEDSLDQIDRKYRDELAVAIITGGELTEDDRKN